MSEPEIPEGGAGLSVELMAVGGPRVHISGEIDFRGAPAVRKQIRDLLKQGHSRVYVHLSDVIFIDSSGISVLLDCARLARELGARLILVSPTQQVMHILDLSGFTPLFEVEHPATPQPAPSIVPGFRESPVCWQISEFVVPCEAELVADIRRRVGQIANSMQFTNDQVEDIKLAVGEAASNAYRHGCAPSDDSTIRVRCVGDANGLTVEISDKGKGFDPESVPDMVRGSLEPGGRGIGFMRLSMDEVHFVAREDGTTVRMVKRLAPGQASPDAKCA